MENSELKIEQQKDNDKLFCKLSGWLDPNTSQDLLHEIDLKDVKSLVLDMNNVEYVFSSGLRVLLVFQKIMEENGGTIKLINVPEQIRFVFEDTGFNKILEIEE